MKEVIDNKRIARNTLLLYFRLFFMVVIQLYTVPVLLDQLGVEEYGLYNVIGSIMALVALVGFLTSGCQRFFSFAIGEDNQEKLKNLFITTRTINVILTIVVLLFLEVVGIWFINNEMKIPEGRHEAAIWVFEFSTIAFCINLLSTPYKALVVAHEKMDYYACVSIGSSLFKLLAALILQFISYDILIFYAFTILLIQVVERLVDQYYCYIHFPESRSARLYMDRKEGRELLIYSGYNIIGGIAFTLRSQGMNVLINLFFGTILNAAHAISVQINSVVSQLVGNLYQASRPQITKAFACGDSDGMWRLVFRTSLLAYYLVMTMSVIAIFELPTILNLWLHEVPEYTVEITRVVLICLILETITNQLISVLQAMNKIKECQLTSCVILLMNLPLAYLVLKYNSSEVMYPYYIQLFLSVLYVASIVIVTNRVAQLKIYDFFKKILLREVIITLITVVTVSCLSYYFDPSIYRVMLVMIFTIVVMLISVLLFGFEKSDLCMIRFQMRKTLKKYI